MEKVLNLAFYIKALHLKVTLFHFRLNTLYIHLCLLYITFSGLVDMKKVLNLALYIKALCLNAFSLT